MTFSLLGYLPKKRVLTASLEPPWLAYTTVEEICSVSRCLASAPPDWIDRWLQNDWGFCDSMDAARSLITANHDNYDLYAFALSSTRYRDGQAEFFDLQTAFDKYQDRPPSPEPLPSNFLSMGFDAVSNDLSSFFECSPLSCNQLAEEVPVNRYCLLDDPEQAANAARRFSLDQPEPGIYYVLQVFRSVRS